MKRMPAAVFLETAYQRNNRVLQALASTMRHRCLLKQVIRQPELHESVPR